MDNLWKEFEKSGSIDAYLRYRNKTQNINENADENRKKCI